MGMDVFGRAPTAPIGEYFRRNMWGWGPLAGLVTELCPAETAPCTDWHHNDGQGLDAEGAAKLAAKLEALRDSGEIAARCDKYNGWYASWVDEQRAAYDWLIIGDPESADVEQRPQCITPHDIDDFIDFLKTSGGFSIW